MAYSESSTKGRMRPCKAYSDSWSKAPHHALKLTTICAWYSANCPVHEYISNKGRMRPCMAYSESRSRDPYHELKLTAIHARYSANRPIR